MPPFAVVAGIPDSLGRLSNLMELNLSWNRLPSEYGEVAGKGRRVALYMIFGTAAAPYKPSVYRCEDGCEYRIVSVSCSRQRERVKLFVQ